LIRDQANKTLDLYIQRVRKFATTMVDSVLPAEPSKPEASNARIGTSTDKSWAGWAISSFTNKIAAADGEIEPTAATSKPAETEATRSASVPRPAKSSPSTQLELPKQTPLRPAAQPLGRSLSDRPVPVVQQQEIEDEGDDVFDAWGAMDDEDEETDPFTAAVASPKISSPDPASSPAPAVSFDDGGEPDFAGWLAAKNQSKAKKPLPKGLNKSSSTNSAPTRSPVTAAKPRAAAPAKKIDTKPKENVDEDDGWGDAWD
jgi:SCY1-like protein 1